MFDDINFKMRCPKCNEELTGFQSKDGNCTLDVLEPEEVFNFYSGCRACGAWVEFTRERPPSRPRNEPLSLADIAALGFVMTSPTGDANAEPL